MLKTEKNQYILLFLFIFIFSTACEEVIDVELDSANPVLVAEGVIEPGRPAWIKLSYTSDYFSEEEVVYEENARVYITDDKGNSDSLSYDSKGIYIGEDIFGEVNTTYTMFINVNNQEYQASSTLLASSKILNVWFGKSGISQLGEDESNYEIYVKIHNDIEQDNYYLFKFFENGEVKNDRYSLANSSYYSEESYLEYNPILVSFDAGSSVEVVLYRLDENTYNYYSQLNDLLEDDFGGSSTPYNPQSNFGDDVLGYFSARSYDTYTADVP